MPDEKTMEKVPISKLKGRLERYGIRVLKYRFAVPEMTFLQILGFIEPPDLRAKYIKFYQEHPAFNEMPAGAKHHHTWKGGLVSHVSEMCGLGFDLLEMYLGDLHGQVTRSDIVIACFLHDFAKVITYRYISKEEKEKTPGKFLPQQIFTIKQGAFRIVDEESWTLLELGKWGITPTEKQWSAVLFAEGGWADANYGPMRLTETSGSIMANNPLAVVIHILDMYSSMLLGKSLVAQQTQETIHAQQATSQSTGTAGATEPASGGTGVPPTPGSVSTENIQLPDGSESVPGSESGSSRNPAA